MVCYVERRITLVNNVDKESNKSSADNLQIFVVLRLYYLNMWRVCSGYFRLLQLVELIAVQESKLYYTENQCVRSS